MQGGLGSNDLGPEHVVVDDLGLEGAELLGQRQHGQPIVRLVDHRSFDAGPSATGGRCCRGRAR